MVPRSDSIADDYDTGPPSNSLMAFVSTAVLARINKRSNSISISMKSCPSASTLLEEVKSMKVQITIGREHVTLPFKSVESTAGRANGMVPRSGVMADHDVAGPSSNSLMAFVPTAVLVRIPKRSYDMSISNATKQAAVDRKDQQPVKLGGLANNSAKIQKGSLSGDITDRDDKIAVRHSKNDPLNAQLETSEEPEMNTKSPNSLSNSILPFDTLSNPEPHDLFHSFVPDCGDDTTKPPSSTGQFAGSFSHEEDNAQGLYNIPLDSSDGDAKVADYQGGWTADTIASESVLSHSCQSSHGPSSVDVPSIPMTQMPAFDYFSQVSHS